MVMICRFLKILVILMQSIASVEILAAYHVAIADRRHFCISATQSSYKRQTRCQTGLNFSRMNFRR